jgi:histone-lysine N-methyltransferase SETMAR
MKRICARFVPRQLCDDQKAHHVSVCRELKQQARGDPIFISNIITGDKTWVYGYDPETKQQSSQWKSPNSPRPKKRASSSQQCRVHVDIFFDIQSIVHKDFLPSGQTVNGKFYCEVLKRLRESIRRKRPDKWKNNWFLHHGNAPAHTSFVVRQFLTSKNIAVISHPPYSPDLASCDFFLFPKIKLRLKGRHFDTTEEFHAELQEDIDTHLRTFRDA